MAPTRKLLIATAAAWAVLLVFCTSTAEASQLNMYELPGCTGKWVPCWDRQCCNVVYTGSYRFYYNDGWPAYLYANADNCNGRSDRVLSSTVSCTDGFPFKRVKRVKQTDAGP